MTVTATPLVLPVLLEEVEVVDVARLSPSFVRVHLASPALAELGCDGTTYDQRIKLILPGPTGRVRLPDLTGAVDGWYAAWLALPEDERGAMRTYTVRDVVGSGADTRLVVDLVVHDGATGPAGRWAEQARVGDRIVVCAPRRGHAYGGIEFAPGDAGRVLLAGDETAVPAVAAILEQLPADARGAAYCEVPTGADALALTHPEGVDVHWLPRDGADRGERLYAAVLGHLGVGAQAPEQGADAGSEPQTDEALVWETPDYSGSGEDVDGGAAEAASAPGDDLYAWIAGESRVVTSLRRSLVRDLGLDRRQVAFMGYWREGVAMRG
ncbi:MAG: NADPH-dependent ferric siderophore reductase [Nocardioides sp.]|nr:NADPH-dependent ferric siderophore reductase [Nocardioides sp.]